MQMNKLKRLRGEAGLSLRALAAIAGVDYSTISQIENDRQKAQLATLGKLSRALNVPLDDLMEFLDTTAVERGKKAAGVSRTKRAKKAADQAGELLALAAR